MHLIGGLKSLASNLDHRRKRSRKNGQRELFHTRDEQSYDVNGNPLPPLKTVVFPRVQAGNHFTLADQGWTVVDMNPSSSDSLYTSYQRLLASSKDFFDLPEDQKEAHKTKLGSEEGWSRVVGEKEFITLRNLSNTPDILKDAASAYWYEAGNLMNEILGKVAESLGLPPGSLTVSSEPCSRLDGRTATVMRLFRYEGFEGKERKVVAEDLGLLSLVIGDTPGLEVHDRHANRSIPIEKTYTTPTQTILVGRQLERLSNSQYKAGGHLVRSYPNTEARLDMDANLPQYRYSTVFVLRAHYPVPVDTDSLTTPITSDFQRPLRNITALDMFKSIHNGHYNINTGKEERLEQKRRLAEFS